MNIHLPVLTVLTVHGAAGLGDVGDVPHPKGVKRKLGKDTPFICSPEQLAAMDEGLCGFLFFSTKTKGFFVCDKRATFCRPNHNDWHSSTQLERRDKK